MANDINSADDISFQLASELTPVLLCREGMVRSPTRRAINGRWAWSKRCFVLVDPQSSQTTAETLRRGGISAPTLFVYKDASSTSPSLAVKLSPLPASSNSNDIDTTVSVRKIDDHATHIKIEVVSLSESLPQWVFVGTDMPRTSARGESFVITWRLKFPNDDTAELWNDCLEAYLAMPPEMPHSPSETQVLVQSGASAVGAAAPETPYIPSEPRVLAQSGASTAIGAAAVAITAETAALAPSLLSDRRKRRALAHFGLLCSLMLYLAFAPRSGGRRSGAPNMQTMTNGNSTTGMEQPPAIFIANTLHHKFQDAWVLTLDAVGTSPLPMEEAPEIHETFLRQFIAFCLTYFAHSSLFRSGSLLFGLPAVIVLAVSTSSIIHRSFGQTKLGRAVARSKYWIASLIFLVAAGALGQDSHVNHLRHPLSYRLYWKAYGQCLCAYSCLAACKILIDRARGIRSRNRVSPARKVASLLACLLTTLSFPLLLRAVEVRASSRSIAFAAGTIAFLCFFVGLHFFGCARRQMVICSIEVGELIYQFSVLPAKFACNTLWVLGDVGQHLMRWMQSWIEPLVRSTIRYLSHALDRIGSKTKVAITRLQGVIESALHNISSALTVGFNFLCTVAKPLLQAVQDCTKTSVSIMGHILSKMSAAILTLYEVLLSAAVQSLCWVLNAFAPLFRTMIRIIQRAAQVLRNFHRICNDFIIDVNHFIVQTLLRNVHRFIIQPLDRTLRRLVGEIIHTLGTFAIKTFRCMRMLGCVLAAAISRASAYARQFTLQFIVPALGRMYNTIAAIMGRLMREVIHILSTLVVKIFQYTRMLGCVLAAGIRRASAYARQFTLHFIVPALGRMYKTIAAIMGPFLKKYWQFVATGLLLNGSLVFAAAALDVAATGKWFASLQYALGAWALSLVGCTIVQGVISSTGNLVRQRVTVDETVLQYVDFHLFSKALQVVAAGWHALSTLLTLVLNIFDFVIRKSLKRLWDLLGSVHMNILKPALQGSTAVLRKVWNSPYVSLFLSLTVLFAIYLHHTEKVLIGTAPSWNIVGHGFEVLVEQIRHQSVNMCQFVGALLTPSAIMFQNIYSPLMYTDVSSPKVALWCWMFTCVVVKTRTRVRIKWFAVPAFLVYFTGGATAALMKAAFASSLIWIGISVFVDHYEDQSRRRTAAAFATFQQQSAALQYRGDVAASAPQESADVARPLPASSLESAPSLPVQEDNAGRFDQKECVICLDELRDVKKCSELPCGHQFHEHCICDWIDKSKCLRCPICRRATGGWDRILEVVF